jgi:hypothetical protein
MSGLSGWKKNGYWKKRLRFKETLEQRIVDSVRQGRHDAVSYISDCYQQYGFSQQPHPFVIEITWLDFAISDRPLSPYQSDNFSMASPFFNIQRLVNVSEISKSACVNYYVTYPTFIEWGSVIAAKVSIVSKIVVDIGCGEIDLATMKSICESNKNIQYFFIAENQAYLNDLAPYGRIGVPDYYYDVDGEVTISDLNNVLVVHDYDVLEAECHKRVSKNFDFVNVKYTDINGFYESINKECVEYGVIMVFYAGEMSAAQQAYMNDLSAVHGFKFCFFSTSISRLVIDGIGDVQFEEDKKYMIKESFLKNYSSIVENSIAFRDNLYFNKSIQKCIVQYINIFEFLCGKQVKFDKVYPL